METGYYRTQELGMTQSQIRKKMKEGKLFRVRRGWYCTHEPSMLDQLFVLQLMHPELVFSGKTALALHLREIPEGDIEALIPKNKRIPNIKGVKIKRSRSLKSEPGMIFRCVSMLEAAITIAEEERPPNLIEKLNKFYAKKQGKRQWNFDIQNVRRRHLAHVVKRDFRLVLPGAYSNQELRVGQGLVRRGYEVELSFKVNGYMFDIRIGKTDLLVELDSFMYHEGEGHKRTFQTDRWKQNAATMGGLRVLRFTTDDTFHYLDLVLDEIERAVHFQETGVTEVWKGLNPTAA